MTDDQARDLLEAIDELRSELRQLRAGGITVRLTDAERTQIARDVYERLDQRLAPVDAAQLDEAPASGARSYFRRRA